MLADHAFYHIVRSIISIGIDVTLFWQRRLYSWWTRKPAKSAFAENLGHAKLFEEWEAAAYQLDELSGDDLWRQNPTSKFYDYRLINERLHAILDAREDDDILGLVNLLRSGLVRNLGNITSPRLFNKAYAGTKLLIEDYITHVALAVDHVATYPIDGAEQHGLSGQAKLDLLHDTRQAFGRSALVLQGGSIFGLCHIGVVKALHLRGLLPRIIVGTGTGALIAALVGIHGEDELLNFLMTEGIDLSAFVERKKKSSTDDTQQPENLKWWGTLLRRLKRLLTDGYFLDIAMLEACVHANVGDMTFEEAYLKTGRVLNITLPTDPSGDIPSLLNYLTAPNVLIWSAAVASNVSQSPRNHRTHLLSKDTMGHVTPWSATSRTASPTRSWKLPSPSDVARDLEGSGTLTNAVSTATNDLRHSPLSRVAELFNVNHFLVSQARPYIAPFLQTNDQTHSSSSPLHNHSSHPSRRTTPSIFYLPLLRVLVLELQHRLRQLDALGLLHVSIRRFLVDEVIPGASLTLVPELRGWDIWGLLWERPTRKSMEEWILRGERSVWPAVSALKVRCTVEVELDRCYQIIRRRKPMDAILAGGLGGRTADADMRMADEYMDVEAHERRPRISRFGSSSSLRTPGHYEDDPEYESRIESRMNTPHRRNVRLRGTGEKRRMRRASSVDNSEASIVAVKQRGF